MKANVELELSILLNCPTVELHLCCEFVLAKGSVASTLSFSPFSYLHDCVLFIFSPPAHLFELVA